MPHPFYFYYHRMNPDIPEACTTDDLLKNKDRVGIYWKTVLYCFSTPISIVLPIVVYLLAGKKTIKNNLLLRLITIFFPVHTQQRNTLTYFLILGNPNIGLYSTLFLMAFFLHSLLLLFF
ncbi:hypothetical protein EROM_041690 [Encephalitozoon romaleae SJ-2008]|uniref:Uncharacterized protein n=1 Tax=Encephalitozoon romaleae (strain SJ-2008) TaxID=1178016 RepID=I7AMJ5_ENCRO|nr:hypothetical protein EROM_041690 [Encephalitozoon romaleae SJ-2008]AFN82934.1 hypothetical protein EROM_041690 [Encephalitozoon romaleae SJ-2008]